jgi:hypothetical protein
MVRMLGAKIRRLTFVTVLAPILAGLISACSDTPAQPTLDELVRRPDFQQCLQDCGVQPGQIGDCMANNPDETSARDCIAAYASQKKGCGKGAIERCFDLRQQQQPDSNSPMGLNCYQGQMSGVPCQ